ncbi:MAG: NADH-quinone oxidoreductase subunit L [Methanothrix sp.]|nr:NADH-quinone oxidoreductase subunit L [Methanothrix sp.]MDD4580391.1 NADH-quinone oxidoreductase subunit L [Methanothrix sp.]
MYADYAYLIVALPVLAFLLCLFIGWHLPRGGGFLTVLATFGALIVSLGIFSETYPNEIIHQSIPWFANFNIGILIDPLALVMLLMVTFVVTLIHTYANGYMNGDPGAARYFAEAALFTASMLGLIYADNLLQLFIFWELVGLCSYLLIGFWYRKPSAAAAAKKAFLTTRVGDVFFLAAIILLYNNMASLNLALKPGEYLLQFPVIYAHIAQIPADQLTLIALGLLGGAVGKSGQFPLHVWLPDAMEGPTTVSAMIHAATMVTAGVYLVARMFPLFYAAPYGLTAVAAVGAFTALFAATMGLTAFDIKRVLAFSTVSQLGFMMAGLGVGAAVGSMAVGVSIFHLIGHSFFKALLFLGAGSVIHAVNTNDMREMGGVGKYMKWTMYTMLVGSLSLAGFPLFTGFFSKDEIILIAYEYGTMINFLPYIFLVLAAVLTAIYTFRMWFSVFTGKERSDYGKHESPMVMIGPLVILAVFAFGFGFAAQDDFYSYLDSNFEHYDIDFANLAAIGSHEFLGEHGAEAAEGAAAEGEGAAGEGEEAGGEPWYIQILPYIVAIGGILLAGLFYWDKIKKFDASQVTGDKDPIRKMLLKGYYQHEIMTGWFAETVVYGTALICNMIDIKLVDGWLNWLSAWVMGFAQHVRKVQTGIIQNYVAALVLGVVVLVVVIALATEVGLV